MRKNSQGFTLVELLAVIVILALIALIATPTVLSIIEKSRKGAAESAAYSYIKAIESYMVTSQLESNSLLENNIEYYLNENSTYISETDTGIYIEGLVEISGTKATDARIILKENLFHEGTFIINGYEVECDSKKCTVVGKNQNNSNEEEPIKKYMEDGILLRYDFDNENNTDSKLYDLTGNNNHGTISGSLITENGIYFDGSNDYVSIAKIDTPNITYDVSFAINSYSSSDRYILSNQEYGGCAISVRNKNVYGICYIDGDYREINSEEINLNILYTASLTYDGSDLKLYLNGELQESYNNSAGIGYSTSKGILSVGTNPNDGEYFGGFINSVRVYEKALSDNQILNNYEVDKSENQKMLNLVSKDPNKIIQNNLLIHYSTFNNTGIGYNEKVNFIADLSENNNNGFLVGPTLSQKEISFDGSNDYIKIGSMNYPNVTYQVVFKTNKNSGSQAIMSNQEYGGCEIGLKVKQVYGTCKIDGSMRMLYGKEIELDTYYLLTLTYDGSELNLYLNDELQDTYTSTAGIGYPSSSGILTLGANPNDGYYFKGNISSARFYSKALILEEIKHNYEMDKLLYFK